MLFQAKYCHPNTGYAQQGSLTAAHDAAPEAGMTLEKIFKLKSERLDKLEKENDAYMASPERKEILERTERAKSHSI